MWKYGDTVREEKKNKSQKVELEKENPKGLQKIIRNYKSLKVIGYKNLFMKTNYICTLTKNLESLIKRKSTLNTSTHTHTHV